MIGQRVRAKVVKNKVAPPFKSAEFDMLYATGISYEGDVLDMAIEKKLITKSGAWFRYGTAQLAQGREKARQYLVDNPDFTQELADQIFALGFESEDEPPQKGEQSEENGEF